MQQNLKLLANDFDVEDSIVYKQWVHDCPEPFIEGCGTSPSDLYKKERRIKASNLKV
jgi:hypothetical protein